MKNGRANDLRINAFELGNFTSEIVSTAETIGLMSCTMKLGERMIEHGLRKETHQKRNIGLPRGPSGALIERCREM